MDARRIWMMWPPHLPQVARKQPGDDPGDKKMGIRMEHDDILLPATKISACPKYTNNV
jgi:hypothetical protein